MARRLEVTPTAYLADPCERPSLSASIAHTLVTRSPAHAWVAHPRLGGTVTTSTSAQDEGTLLHSLLLGKGPEIAVIDAADFRTKAAREQRDEAIARGALPVIADKYVTAHRTASELLVRFQDFGLTLDGESEVAIEFESNDVLCRAMLDHVYWSDTMVLDLKKIVSADSQTCSKHAYQYGYDIQWAAYTSALEALEPEMAGRVDFLFLFFETEPPYAVVPRRPDGVLKELGQRRWNRAVEIWQRCTSSEVWPAYADDIDILYAPAWALAEHQT